MTGKGLTFGAARAAVVTLAIVTAILPGRALAAAVTAFVHDPTCNQVYFGFNTDQPFDAYKVTVQEINCATGAPVGAPIMVSAHPHGATAANGVVNGLSCGKCYRFKLFIRWNHGGPWTGPVRNFVFQTNPCGVC